MTTIPTDAADATTSGTDGARTGRLAWAATLRAAGRDQALVASGQALAGAGNLVFVAVAARVLSPGGFGHLAAFIALLAVLNLPGAGLAAAGALRPERAAVVVRQVGAASIATGVLVALLAGPLSGLLGLPVPFVLALAVAAPAAPLLGLWRGVAYGVRAHRAVVLSLLAEPAARLGLGLALGLAVGAAGAVWGVALGGWIALAVLMRSQPAAAAVVHPPAGAHSRRGRAAHPTTGGTAATGLAFVGLAFLQHQDLILANRVLEPGEAGAFAAVSTLGGLVAFATATLPFVLLPSSVRDATRGLPVALGAAVVVAVGAVLVAVVAGEPLVGLVVGDRYAEVVSLAPVYMGAMGALGVARVLAAQRCREGEGRAVALVVAGVALANAVAIVGFARTPGQVVAATAVPLVLGAVVVAIPSEVAAGWLEVATDRVRHVLAQPDARLLVALTALALGVRLATERSIWVDEAISIRQAQLPLGTMLADLRATDVHPPLHHLVLWVSVRVLGTAEWAVRLPSVLFGVALVPVMYGTARELFDRRTAQVAAALAVPAPFLVWYSQEARMYSLFMLIGVCGVWAQVAALRRGRRDAFIAWGVASAALVWTQWFALLPIAVQQLVTVVHVVRRRMDGGLSPTWVRRWLGSLLVTAVLLLPLVGFLLGQLAAYGERGAGLSLPGTAGTDASAAAGGLSTYSAIANALWAVVGYHNDDVMVRLGALWPLAMLGALLLLGRRLRTSTGLVLAVALVPGLVLFAVAHTKRDLFELRYFVLAAPLLLLVVARAATTVARSRPALHLVVGGLLALSTVALVDQQVNGTNPRLYDFRGAVGEIERTASDGDVIAHAPGYLDGVLGYYAPELDSVELDELRPDEVDGQIYVVVTERFLNPTTAGDIGDHLARIGEVRGEPARFERPNVIVWRFP